MTSQRTRLSDTQIRRLSEPGKHADGVVPGLFLLITPAGGKVWRMKYRLNGKEGLFSIGRAGEGGIGVTEARRMAQEARSHIARGVAPLAAKTAEKAAQKAAQGQTFETVARQWLAGKTSEIAPITLTRYRGALEGHVFDRIGRTPVSELRLADVLAVTDCLRDRPSAARHAFMLVSQVLDFAEGRDLVDRNVCAITKSKKESNLPKRKKVVHRAALMEPAKVGAFLRALDAYPSRGTGVVSALRCLPYLPVRPSELCRMQWREVDLDAGLWSFRMTKTDEDHAVPLPSQIVGLLRDLKESGSGEGYVFKSNTHRGRPISRDSLWAGILRLGYDKGELSSHGWRATFRTVNHEVLSADPAALELSLGHKAPGSGGLGKAYNRVQLMEQRKAIAQRYADWLDAAKAGAAFRG